NFCFGGLSDGYDRTRRRRLLGVLSNASARRLLWQAAPVPIPLPLLVVRAQELDGHHSVDQELPLVVLPNLLRGSIAGWLAPCCRWRRSRPAGRVRHAVGLAP